MARYIDAEELQEEIKSLSVMLGGNSVFKTAKESVLRIIDDQPTADVMEVKHGHWIEDIKEIVPLNGIVPIKTLVGYRCSECGRAEICKEPYCNCGAKMVRKGDT